MYQFRLDFCEVYTVQHDVLADMAEAKEPVCQVELPIYKSAILLVLLEYRACRGNI